MRPERRLLAPVLAWVAACGGGRRAEAPVPESAVFDAPGSPPVGATGAEAAPAEPRRRMVIRTAEIVVRVDDPRSVGDAAGHMAVELGGFVVKNEAVGVGHAVVEAHVTLRVPADRFDGAMIRLRDVGVVLRESVSGQDVTEEYVDHEAQLRAKRTLESRMLDLLGRTGTLEDILKVETELARVRTDVERIEGRLRYLSDQAAMATITLVAVSPDRPTAEEGESLASRFSNAAVRAGSAFTDTAAGMIVLVGGATPPLVVTGLLWLAIRRVRKRKSG